MTLIHALITLIGGQIPKRRSAMDILLRKMVLFGFGTQFSPPKNPKMAFLSSISITRPTEIRTHQTTGRFLREAPPPSELRAHFTTAFWLLLTLKLPH